MNGSDNWVIAQVVPEPSALALLICAIGCTLLARLRKGKRTVAAYSCLHGRQQYSQHGRSMENRILQTTVVDPNLNSYKWFFDHKWCQVTLEAVRIPLWNALSLRMLAWRWTDGTHSVPWLMVEQLRASWQGEVEDLWIPDWLQPTGRSRPLAVFASSNSQAGLGTNQGAIGRGSREEEATAKAVQTAQSDIQAAVVAIGTRYLTNPSSVSHFCFAALNLSASSSPMSIFLQAQSGLRKSQNTNRSPELWEGYCPTLRRVARRQLLERPEVDIARLVRMR